MRKPLLQIALDTFSIEEAIKNVKQIEESIDIIEVGTILLAAEGKKAISAIKKEFPSKIIIADGKIADAGSIFANMFFEEGADFTTVICAAENPTISSVVKEAQKSPNRDVQIELTNNFTWKQVEEWKKLGVSQVVWHRSRDSQAAGVKWNEKDIESINKLINLDYKVTITGGISVSDLAFFKDLPIYIFIAGRSIRDAKNPKLAAKEFKDEINKLWN